MQTVYPAPALPSAPPPYSPQFLEEDPAAAELTADQPLRFDVASLQQWLDLNA